MTNSIIITLLIFAAPLYIILLSMGAYIGKIWAIRLLFYSNKNEEKGKDGKS